jgi:hypothetical protein
MIFAPQERLAVYPDLYQKCNVSIPNPRFFNPDAFATGEQNINWLLHTWLSKPLHSLAPGCSRTISLA